MGKKNSLISKGRYELRFRGDECLNCGHPLHASDKYCPSCSQANSIKKLTLKDYVDEFFSSLINYDSKLLKTLTALLIKPGTITKDFINGKRVTYTNPFRFLLSLAFLYFLMVTFNNNFANLDREASKFDGNISASGSPVAYNVNSGSFTADSVKFKNQTAKVLAQLDSTNPGTRNVRKGVNILDSLMVEANVKEANKDSLISADPTSYYKKMEEDPESGRFLSKMEFFSRMIKVDTLYSFKEAQEKYNIKSSFSNKMAFQFSNSILKVSRQPGSFINSTISKLPFVIFLFLPVFAVFIWLVYIRKNHTYTDHLIFSFHNQSLLFILLILSFIIDAVFTVSSAGIFILIFSIYLFLAMKKFYGQGIFKTLIKYIFLNTIFGFLALFAIIMLLTGSVFTY